MGGGSYQVGKGYLVYAAELDVKDVVLEDGFFWYGWADVLPAGSKILVPQGVCRRGGV